MGLPTEVQNLLILIYAQQTNRSFTIHGAPDDATLGNIRDLCVLREQTLPPPEQWATALERAGSIFGLAPSPLLNASNVATLVAGVKQRVADGRLACQNYCQKLRDRTLKLNLPPSESDRLRTATATLRLLEKIHLSSDDAVVGALALAEVATSESSMGECLNNAGTLAGTLDGTNWEIFEAIEKLADERTTAAAAIRTSLGEVLRCDEHVKSLAGVLREAQSKAVKLLTVVTPSPRRPPRGRRMVDQGKDELHDIAAAREKLEQLAKLMNNHRRIEITIAWRIDEETP